MDLSTKLSHLSGIGPSLAKKLERLNLNTVEDLIYHFPFRYDDFSNISTTLDAKIGERVTLQGEIWSINNVYTRFRKVLTKAIFNDGSGTIELIWFNSPWLLKQINTGDRVQVSGKVSKKGSKLSITMPVWEKMGSSVSHPERSEGSRPLHTGRLVPVYPETYGLTSKWIRAKIASVLPLFKNAIKDHLPSDIKQGMVNLEEAIFKIHFPDSYDDVSLAKERLSFDELFLIQLATLKARQAWKSKKTLAKLEVSQKKISEFIGKLPFKLTGAQQRVLKEIIADLETDTPMNRMLQGEVGSGKTVVAAIISYLIYLNGKRTLFMAPTEILAFQHYETFSKLLSDYGITVGLYTGSKKYTKHDLRFKNNDLGKRKNHTSSIINHKSGPNIIVGTHALLSEKLIKEGVGLVIVDEQQRFGVEQRTLLRNASKTPHFLTMTATPIPRSVALTLYGDLDLSIIDEMPKGRKIVKTFVVPSKKRRDSYGFIRKKVSEGDQVYIITPLIEFSETLASSKAAKVEFEKLKKVFPDLRVGLLHGRLKSKEKESAINSFKEGKIDILVSTSVVEVGMDIPNATIMIIEGAERFGLAQLHQLRGRVGRGDKESFCFLFAGEEGSITLSRLRHLEKTFNGLELAELDLKIRGSGDLFGIRQSGRFELKIASFFDLPLLEKAKGAATDLLKKDPTLDNHPSLKLKLAQFASEVMPD